MKEIHLKKNLEDLENAKLLADHYQNTDQFSNYGARLWKIGKAVIYIEDLSADSNEYLLERDQDQDEIKDALEDPHDFLENCISEWIGNDDDPKLAAYQWYPERARENQYTGNDDCKILIVGWYNGYQPVNWLKDDQQNDIVFNNSQEAQTWIDEDENKIYYRSHNEAGRPDYYIIEN